MYKIEKNIDMNMVGVRTRYPFMEMDVGDSFSVSVSEKQKVHSAACYCGKRNNRKFSTQKQLDGSYRCWRVK